VRRSAGDLERGELRVARYCDEQLDVVDLLVRRNGWGHKLLGLRRDVDVLEQRRVDELERHVVHRLEQLKHDEQLQHEQLQRDE
jgi:hypothetical protein